MHSYCPTIISLYKRWQLATLALRDSSPTDLSSKIQNVAVAKAELLDLLLAEVEQKGVGGKLLSLIDYMAISALKERGYQVIEGTQDDFGPYHLVYGLTLRIPSEAGNTRQDVLPPMCSDLIVYTEKDIRIADFPTKLESLLIRGSVVGNNPSVALDLNGEVDVEFLQLEFVDLKDAKKPLPSVKNLVLKDLDLRGVDLGMVFPNLEYIAITNVAIDVETLHSIGKHVDVIHMTGINLPSKEDFSFLPQGCRDLSLTNVGLTSWSIDQSRSLPRGLRGLKLSNNWISSFSLSGLPKNLKELNLNGNPLKDLDLRGQSTILPSLRRISFSGNSIKSLAVDEEFKVFALHVHGLTDNIVFDQLQKAQTKLSSQGLDTDWRF